MYRIGTTSGPFAIAAHSGYATLMDALRDACDRMAGEPGTLAVWQHMGNDRFAVVAIVHQQQVVWRV